MAHAVKTCLWFDHQAEEAARFYVSLLPGSQIGAIIRLSEAGPSDDGKVLLVEFTLAGTPYQALNGGPMFPPSEYASISVATEDQAETDRLWTALTADGGAESMCGWLKDKFDVSWQIVPRVLPAMLSSPDRAAAGRAMAAMMTMKRIDIAALEMAFAG